LGRTLDPSAKAASDRSKPRDDAATLPLASTVVWSSTIQGSSKTAVGRSVAADPTEHGYPRNGREMSILIGKSRDTEPAHRPRHRVVRGVAMAAMTAAIASCAGAPPAAKTPAAMSSAATTSSVRPSIPVNGITVSGNRLVNGAGVPVQLRGVSRMSTEYACIQGWGIFSQATAPGDKRTDAQENDATLSS